MTNKLLNGADIGHANAVYKEKGIEIGVKKAKLITAKAMLAKGLDIETIIEITELMEEMILQ